MCVYTQKIPFFGLHHSAIVIGKGRSNAKALQCEFNLTLIESFRYDDGNCYFIIKGLNERDVNHATISVQRLLLLSMARMEHSQTVTLDVERRNHRETCDKLMAAELQSSLVFPPLTGKISPPLTGKISPHIVPRTQKKVSFAPMVEFRWKVLYPCELNN